MAFNQSKYINDFAKEKGFKSTNEYITNLIHSDMEKA